MKYLATLLIVVGTLAAPACSGGPMLPPYPTCETDAHCKEHGELCVKGVCQECRSDANCTETGARCIDNECVGKGG